MAGRWQLAGLRQQHRPYGMFARRRRHQHLALAEIESRRTVGFVPDPALGRILVTAAATAHSRVKGLVTVALLKSNYDARRDHVEMFQPFLLDTLSSLQADDFTVELLQDRFRERHGLTIPMSALSTLLNRAKKHGHVRRDGGRYFRIPGAIPDLQLPRRRAEIDREHNALAESLRKYAASKQRIIASDAEALALLLAFLEENQIAFLLDDPNTLELVSPPSLPERDASIVARFVTDSCLRDPDLAKYVERMLEGFVLQNALLLRDIGSISGTFRDLTAFFDTPFLFGALGLDGPVIQRSAVESVNLFKTTQIRIAVLENTIDEMRSVLAAYERHLGSSEGIRSLFPGPLTSHFLSSKYGPADVRQAAAMLERNLRDLGLAIWRMPRHDRRYTWDEEDLAKRISHSDPSEPRVVHDVNCIAAVLTLRTGHTANSWDHAKYVFATTTGLLVGNAVRWYKAQHGTGVAPLLHVATLSDLAWLKKPAAAPLLKVHELVAMCSAALRPRRDLWAAFIRHLRLLEERGTLNSDESVAIVADQLTQTLLLDLEEERPEDSDVDAVTLSEIVERVRASQKETADRQVAAAQAVAGATEEMHRQWQLHLLGRLGWMSTVLSDVAFFSMAVVLVAGATLGLVHWPGAGASVAVKVGVRGTLALVAVFATGRAIWGGNLQQLRLAIRELVRRRLTQWFTPNGIA